MKLVENYELVKTEYIKELDTETYLLRHKKTGARILVMENDDTNKVFAIGFRTPVSDSTGVPHIIEHSVLCGSEKYPVKDPFMELAKSSLNTFLNAMTFADKTVYPVASCNDKDLRNLMSVYMDAVLHPNIHKEDKIFKQEGWHYELESADAPLEINGIVYSEMKGAFSDPEDVLDRYCQNSLYPDTNYGFESGGDPEVIPNLTYEAFCAFHKRYYHPSNSYIYLYGDMDMEDQLDWLDKEYLSKYDYLQMNTAVTPQAPFSKMTESEILYPIGEDEDPEGKAWMSLQWSVGDSLDNDLYYAIQVIEYALIGSEGAPLKEALIKSGIGEDVFGGCMGEVLQPFFKVTIKNTDKDKKETFLKIVNENLEKVAREGFDPKAITAAINSLEFRTKESDFGGYPKGLVFCFQALESWLYDDNEPTMHLKSDDTFAMLRSHINDDYFQNLIKKYFVDNKHASLVSLVPSPGLATKREEALAKKLAEKKASLSNEEINKIIMETKALKEYQGQESTKEELATLPHLELSDLDPCISKLSTVEKNIAGKKVLHHEIFTRGITYINLIYDLADFTKEEIMDAALLREVIGFLDTEKYGYGDLSNEITLQTGSIDFSISIRESIIDGSFKPGFEITSKFLHDKQDAALSVIFEMLMNTKYIDVSRLIEVLKQLGSRNEMKIQSMSHSIAVNRALSYESKSAAYKEFTSGVDYMRFINDIAKNAEYEAPALLKRLEKIAKKAFSSDRLLVSITDDNEGFESILSIGAKYFGTEEYMPRDLAFSPETVKKNEAFITPSQVNYVALGGILPNPECHNGAQGVLRAILANEFLWVALRVKGGAYGSMCSFSRNDKALFVSYRDPNLKSTYETYKEMPEYIANFTADERKLTNFIISVIGAIDTPLTPSQWGAASLTVYLSGYTDNLRQKERDQIIGCKVSDIVALAPRIKALIDKWQICTVGGAGAIRDAEAVFDKVENLL